MEKSRFIALLYPIFDLREVDEILQAVKNDYKGARHYCYAYRFMNNEKAYDDGEPKNTAGLPLLSLLQKRELFDVILIVVRYFGGKKLGAARLLRTYSDAGNKVIDTATFFTREAGLNVKIRISLPLFNQTKKELEYLHYKLEDILFHENDVTFSLLISVNKLPYVESHYNIVERDEQFIYQVINNE